MTTHVISKLKILIIGLCLLKYIGNVIPVLAEDRTKPSKQSVSSNYQAQKLKIQSRLDQLVQQLGDTDYFAREKAMNELYRLGTVALPTLNASQNLEDLEIQWRVRKLLTCIKWKLSPRLLESMAAIMDDYEQEDWQTRQEICQDLGIAGKEKVIPTLLEIIKLDPSPSVQRTAIATLYKMGDIGMNVLIENGIDVEGLEPYYVDIFVSLGNRYLAEKKYKKAKIEYQKALKVDPENAVAAYNMACVFSLLKDYVTAIQWLENSVKNGFDDFKWMREDPDLKNLQGRPRYESLLRNRGNALDSLSE